MPFSTERYPLTVEQRKQLGQDLAHIREEVQAITAMMCACYGSESPRAIRASEVAGAMQRLEWELERSEEIGQVTAA